MIIWKNSTQSLSHHRLNGLTNTTMSQVWATCRNCISSARLQWRCPYRHNNNIHTHMLFNGHVPDKPGLAIYPIRTQIPYVLCCHQPVLYTHQLISISSTRLTTTIYSTPHTAQLSRTSSHRQAQQFNRILSLYWKIWHCGILLKRNYYWTKCSYCQYFHLWHL